MTNLKFLKDHYPIYPTRLSQSTSTEKQTIRNYSEVIIVRYRCNETTQEKRK